MNFIKHIWQTYQKGKKYDEKMEELREVRQQLEVEEADDEKLQSRISELQSALKEARTSIKELKDKNKSPDPQSLKNFFMYPDEQTHWTYSIRGGARIPVTQAFKYSDEQLIVDKAQEVVEKGGLRDKDNPTQVADYFYRYVESNWDWDYTVDKKNFGKIEYWNAPDKSAESMEGDCVAEDEEIITKDGIQTVKELEVGDKVLSYNFNEEEYVYKPITKKWDKGIQQIKSVEFRNGKSINVTEDHPMMVRTNQNGDSNYEKTYLSDVDMSRGWKKRVPSSKNLEVDVKDNPEFTENHAFVLGHFCAEGWTEPDRVRTSGYELDEILPILDKLGIKYSENKNGSGVPTAEIFDEEFKSLCLSVKENSFNISLPEWILHLPEEKIQRFVDGYFLGDGHIKHHSKNNSYRVYSTSSKQLAEDLGFMLNRLGEPTYQYKQLDHGGVGSEPIYRLHTNPNSHFCNDCGYEKMSEVGIKNILDGEKKQVYDFQVQDTHTFFFKNGIMSHNCDDLMLLMHVTLRKIFDIIDMEEAKWRIRSVASRTLAGGHAYNIWLGEDCEWYVMESTMDMSGSLDKTWLETPLRENNFYYSFYGFATPERTWRGDIDAVSPYEDEEEKHYHES